MSSLILYANNERSVNSSIGRIRNDRAFQQIQNVINLSANFLNSALSAAALSTLKTFDALVDYSNPVEQIFLDITNTSVPGISAARLSSIQTYYNSLTPPSVNEFVFYRKKKEQPYDITLAVGLANDPFKTMTVTNSFSTLALDYTAEYSINGGTYLPFTNFNPITIPCSVSDNTQNPILCSFSVNVSSLNKTAVPAQNFTFSSTLTGVSGLSATALFFEDWLTNDLYAFYWNLTAVGSDVPLSALTAEPGEEPAIVLSLPNAEGILFERSPVSPEVTTLISAVQAITGRNVNIFEMPVVSSNDEVLYWVERRLSQFTSLQIVTANDTVKIIQSDIPDLTPTHSVSTLGGVSYSYTLPPISGDGIRFSLTAIFLNEIPSVDFIAYPDFVLSDTTPLSTIEVTKNNYTELVENLAFIGEGHSQLFNLSGGISNGSLSGTKRIIWSVGSTTPQKDSRFTVNNITPDGSEATVLVNSTPGVEASHPIAAFALDSGSYIDENSPTITYPDGNGGEPPDPINYPFFYSTADPGIENTNPLKTGIFVAKYPEPYETEITDPFANVGETKLPYDGSTQRFIINKTTTDTASSIFVEEEVNTKWKLKAEASNNVSWSIEANTDPYVENYIFDLAYDEDQNAEYLPLFRTSNYVDTTINVEVSCYKKMSLNVAGFPIYEFRFSYTPLTLSTCSLAFGDIIENKVRVFYWGGYGAVDNAVSSLTSTLGLVYNTDIVELTGTAINSTSAMVSSVYTVLSSITSLNVSFSGNVLTIEQRTILPELFAPYGSGKIKAQKKLPPLSRRDWQPRVVPKTAKFQTKVLSHPLSLKLYTPNFYVLKETDVPFTVHYEQHGNYVLSAVDVSSNSSLSSIRLFPTTKGPDDTLLKTTTDNLFFNKVGLADIKLTAYVFDLRSERGTDLIVFERMVDDIVEVVEEYDQVNPDFYYTYLAPPAFSETEAPLLSPNEWLVQDNINDSLKRLYNTFHELNNLTSLYTNKSKIYSWISFQQTPSEPLVFVKKYTWQDLECQTNLDAEDQTVWFNFECENPNDETQRKNLIWQDHFCIMKGADPNCRQLYCMNWKWRLRKEANSNTKVTWKATKRGNVFQKRWRYEPCDTDSLVVNCNKLRWIRSSFDKNAFPIPYSTVETPCALVDMDYIESLDCFVLAHQKEIRLYKNNLESAYLSRRGSADELFSFQDIVGIAVNSEGRIYVLDRILPKVSVIQFNDEQLASYDSWGNYGLKDNPIGFNKPSDIHIDQDNFVWIADTGNKCVKKFTSSGRAVLTLQNDILDTNPPTSICVDSEYNLHVLSNQTVFVFSSTSEFKFSYTLDSNVSNPTKINTNYNREIIYVAYDKGIAKYFKDGDMFGYLVKDYICKDGSMLSGFVNISQDKFRNTLAIVSNKVLKIGDLMKVVDLKGYIPSDKYWSIDDILVDREEYVQPWVYLRGFHRLWDNIELIRSALFYNINKCKVYTPPVHKKEDLVIGQNELVTNTVLNRLIKQLWDNLETLKKYFDVECEKNLI